MKAKEETAVYVQTTLYYEIGGILQSGIQDVLQVKLPRPKPESMEAEFLHKRLQLVRDSALTTLNFCTYNSRPARLNLEDKHVSEAILLLH